MRQVGKWAEIPYYIIAHLPTCPPAHLPMFYLIYRLISCVLLAAVLSPTLSFAVEPSSPHLNVFLSDLGTRRPETTPIALMPYLEDSLAIQLSQHDMEVLLTATLDDSLTLLRATVQFAGWVKIRGIPVFVKGKAVKEAVQKGYVLGLTFPLDHLAYICFVPNPSMAEDFQAHIRLIYTQQYTYPFDKDIFNANVLIQGQEVTYEENNNRQTGYLVTTDVYDNRKRVLYTNIQGILGQKRGVLGFLQKVFFFVPKTLNGLELTQGDLIIDAFINQTIENFEHEPRYRVTRR